MMTQSLAADQSQYFNWNTAAAHDVRDVRGFTSSLGPGPYAHNARRSNANDPGGPALLVQEAQEPCPSARSTLAAAGHGWQAPQAVAAFHRQLRNRCLAAAAAAAPWLGRRSTRRSSSGAAAPRRWRMHLAGDRRLPPSAPAQACDRHSHPPARGGAFSRGPS